MFGRGSKKSQDGAARRSGPAPHLTVYDHIGPQLNDHRGSAFQDLLQAGRHFEFREVPPSFDRELIDSDFILAMFLEPATLDKMADMVLARRRDGSLLTLIIATMPSQLVALGRWLDARANEDRLAGIRLVVASNENRLWEQIDGRLVPVTESNLIRMPMTTEVEDARFRNFYVFSPKLQTLVARVRAYAQNGIHRAYLLGGPGSGKTSLAYYYFLIRNRGRFVSVNLAAENTGDKAAVKSLLCGHVAGAFPGAGARIGAFTQARDGVCFLDESHGVMGPVMEVLMEALDNSQYLPFGAAAKQKLDCALLFATNRGWKHLMESVNIDEFTRLGAATLNVPELADREEDMIAITATMLAKLAAACTSWRAPAGLEDDAWERIRSCRWHGNARALVRTLEAAFVDCASRGAHALMPEADVQRGIELWEPAQHHSHTIYGITE